MHFQYDHAKAKSNYKKHGVSFADAEGIFYDPLALHPQDTGFREEERFVAIGMGSAGRIVVVVYTFRGEEILLISACLATRRELKQYEK